MTSPERKTLIRALTFQALRRWWDWDLPFSWRPLDRPTYRAVKRRLRRLALREAVEHIPDG